MAEPSAADRWRGPYRPDHAFPHHLVDDDGRHLFLLGKTAWTYFACADPEGLPARRGAGDYRAARGVERRAVL